MWENDTYSYKGWMTSDYFLKRALGVWGHNLVASLLIMGIIIGIVLVFAIIAAFMFGMASGLV